MAPAIFISYSRRDQEFVLRLAVDLEERGAAVWIDQGDIQGGDRWRQSIATGIARCQIFLLVVSPDALRSPYVGEEIELALQAHKPILPILYRQARIADPLNTQLAAYQMLNFRHGGYAQNLADLLTALDHHGIPLHAAAELSDAERLRRRRERLGEPVQTQWGAVFGRIPGWAVAWALGWAIYWFVLQLILLFFAFNSERGYLISGPIGGLAGGFVGGLFAGLLTMLALRHHAVSIRWRHMAAAIRIWGLVGPVATAVAGGLVVLLYTASEPDCSALGFGECVGAVLGSAFGNAIFQILSMLFYTLIALLLIGALAGWLAVRHIRRLEPGILGRQSILVVFGWAAGGIIAALVGAIVAGAIQG